MKRPTLLLVTLPLLAAACTNSGCTSTNPDGGLTSSGEDAGSNGGGATGGVPDTFAWANAYSAGEGTDVMAMAADSSGVVVAGKISGTATIGATTLSAQNSAGNAFIAKLDPSGNVLWAKVASGAESAFESVLVDASGNVFVSGAEYGDAPTVTFGGTTLTPNTTSGKIGADEVSSAGGMIARLDASGNLTWLKLAETTTEVDLGALVFSGSNVVVAGALNGSGAFGPGETLPVTCTTATKECVFFAAYDTASGTPAWAVVAPNTPARGNSAGNPHQVQIGADAAGNLFLGIGASFEGVGSTDDTELVVNKYDPTGALTWNKVFTAGTAQPGLDGFVVDTNGNSYLLGDSAAGLVLGSTTIDSEATGDFIAKLDSTGAVTWAKTLDLVPAGNTGLALGASSILTFGNGDDAAGILPDTVVSMDLGRFDPATGTLSSTVACGIAHAIGKVVATTGAITYVAGDGASPGVFGHVTTTDSADAGDFGLFVAKLK